MQKVVKTKLPELFKYLAVGLLTNLVDFLLYGLLLLLTGNFLVAENLKIPVVLGLNYFAHRKFTFKSQNRKPAEITRYLLANLVIWLFANLTLIVLVWLLGQLLPLLNSSPNNTPNLVEILAKIGQLVIVPAFSYILFKLVVYKNAKH